MTGGLMQLVAYGAQDLYLTGNPQVTFFKAVYKRHTNFSMEYIPQYFQTLPTFSTTENTIVQCKIDRNGDLIHDMYLVFDVPPIYSTNNEFFTWIDNLGQNLINYCNVSINGLVIDQLYSQWLNIWSQLTVTRSQKLSYDRMIGNTPDMKNPEVYYGVFAENTQPTISGRRLYVPLPFWFCRNPGLSIPLIALQYTEVFITVEFNALNNLFNMWYDVNPNSLFEFGSNPNSAVTAGVPAVDVTLLKEINDKIVTVGPNARQSAYDLVDSLLSQGFSPINYFWKFVNGTQFPGSNWTQNSYLLVNYIYLDEDERKRFAQVSHEYLITQTFRQEFSGLQGEVIPELKINHPVKEIFMVPQRNDVNIVNQWNNYTNCLYFKEFYSVNWLENLNSFSLFETFKEKDINPCLPSFVLINEGNDFDINQGNIIITAKLILNGHDRQSINESQFYNSLIPYKYHTNSPSNGILCYNFGIKPEEFQPSGTCNFSRINRAQMSMKLRSLSDLDVTYNVNFYYYNNNVFRIMGGIGSLVFTN